MGTARKQYSRKLAAILTVLAMVLALFPVAAFAQEAPKFSDIAGLKLAKEIEEAAKAGLVEGYPDGTFKPKQNVTRAEFAKMIVNAVEKATGKALETGDEPFSDVEKGQALYDYVVKAYKAGYIKGYEDGTFGYDKHIVREEAAAIIQRALKLEEAQENFDDVSSSQRLAGAIGAVAKAGIMTGYDAKRFGPRDNVQRDQAAAIAVRAYNYLKQQQPAVLKVAEVRVPNLKQVEVVFDQPVDKASAEDVNNYRVYAQDQTENLIDEGSAKLQEDGKTVVLTLEGDKAFANNSKANKVEVLTGVKSAAGKALEQAYSTTVAAVDTVTPTAASVRQIGSRWLEVTFNEPVKAAPGKVQVRVDGGAIGVKLVEENYAGRSLRVTTYADIKEGEHTVTVVAKSVTDFAGLENQVDQELKFQAVKDETVPTVSVTKATPTQIKLSFSKPVVIPASDNIRFRAVYNTDRYEIKASQLSDIGSDKLVTELTLPYGSNNALPLGKQKLYIEYVNDSSADVIKSAFGITVPEQALDVDIQADTTKPSVAEIKVVDSQTLHVVFNKAIDDKSVELKYFELKDANGKAVTISTAKRHTDKGKENIVVLTLATPLQGGTYTLKVSGIKDTAYPQNVMDEFTGTFEAKDMVAPRLEKVQYSGNKIFLTFSEPMATEGVGSVLNKARYSILIDGQTYTWQSTDKVAVSNGDRLVTITISQQIAGGNDSIKVDYVTDKAGNPLPRDDRDKTWVLNQQAGVSVVEAAFIATNRLQVKFDYALANVVTTDFSLSSGQSGPKIEGIVNHDIRDGKSVVVFALKDAVTADGKFNKIDVKLNVSNPSSATAEGIPLNAQTDIPVRDRIAPSLVADKPVRIAHGVGASIIRIAFDEPIQAGSFGTSSFKVSGYRVTSASLLSGDSKVIELVVTPEAGASKTPTVELVTPVRDASGNDSATWTQTAVLAGSPSVTLTLPTSPVKAGDAITVSATASNPADGLAYDGVIFNVAVVPSDPSQFKDGDTITLTEAQTNTPLTLTYDTKSKAFKGVWGSGFTMSAEYNVKSTFNGNAVYGATSAKLPSATYTVRVDMVAGGQVLATGQGSVTVQ